MEIYLLGMLEQLGGGLVLILARNNKLNFVDNYYYYYLFLFIILIIF